MLYREWELAMLETRRKYIVQVGKNGHDEILSTWNTGAKYKVLAKEILRRCTPDNEALQKVYNKVSKIQLPFSMFITVVSGEINVSMGSFLTN
jgi:hypothetical protein